MKRDGRPASIVTDGYSHIVLAMNVVGNMTAQT